VTTSLLDKPLVRIDPRPAVAYPGGGSDSLARVGPNVGGLVTANALTASSTRRGSTLTSAASITDVTVRDILTATVAGADCAAGPNGVTGRSSVAALTVLGQQIDVTLPGEIDVLGVAKVRVDEQIRTGDTLTVNAVHVLVGGPAGGVTGADIVLSQAKCTWPGTIPTTPPTTTATTGPTRPTSSTQPPRATTTTPHPTSSSRGARGIHKVSDDRDLAETGATGILPISVAGLILLAGGGWALFLARRKNPNSGS
jgi:LPXTG-motif cell wall-anchored protein